MVEAAEICGVSISKLLNYLETGKVFPPVSRRNNLTFSHHMEVCRLPEEDRERLLSAAEAGDPETGRPWSRDRLRDAGREVSGRAEAERLRAEKRRASPRAPTGAHVQG